MKKSLTNKIIALLTLAFLTGCTATTASTGERDHYPDTSHTDTRPVAPPNF